MLTSIKKVKGLGVFRDFSADAALPKFGRFNVIYGENGTGKTTLSRLFRAIEDGDHADYPDLAFTVAAEGGDLTKGKKCARKIRVFNADYVAENLGRFDGPLKHILIVGAENKALAEELKVEEASYLARTEKAKSLTVEIEKLEKDKGRIFTAIAATIGEAISGATQRRYRKPDAEAAYVLLKSFKVLTEKELEPHHLTVRQEQTAEIPVPSVGLIDLGDGSDRLATELANLIPAQVKTLALRSAQAGAIKRLSEHPDIAQWVESGRTIHEKHSSSRCEYCDQTIPPARLGALAKHFGIEDQKLKTDIEAAAAQARLIYAEIGQVELPPKAELYSELRDNFGNAAEASEREKAALLEAITAASKALDRKLGARASSYEEVVALDSGAFTASLGAAVKFIEQHNAKSGAFEMAKMGAQEAIVGHYLSSVAPQVNEFEKQIAAARAGLTKAIEGDEQDKRSLEQLEASIRTKKAQIANAHVGGELMTGHLKTFLGRTELSFEAADEGYLVKRRGVPAKRLSEGEKTAIAFLYFLVQLDEDFDIAEGIVVIDDPISSLDSSSIYQAFAHLKNSVKGAKQVFLLTHNFDFLKILINWINGSREPKCYLMLVCAESADGRDAKLIKLDRLLVDHPTEYHYLFKVLISFKSDGTIANSYHIPNVARKVLETFLDFHAPANGNLYDKLAAITFDENKKTAIYKFTNDQSHRTGKGFDPALVAETQKNATHLLELIEATAPVHFKGLKILSGA